MKTITLNLTNRAIKCNIEGNGKIPCLVVGAANLFSNGRLSKGLEDIFKFYFVDFWEEKTKQKEDKDLTWESIAQEIDDARIALGLNQIAVLGQSAGGAIALEYFRQYPMHCFFAIPIALYPNYQHKNNKKCDCATCERAFFIRDNATPTRKSKINELDLKYKNEFKSNNSHMTESLFIKKFHADRPMYWKSYGDAEIKISTMWKDYHPNVSRVIQYATQLLSKYNFFNRHEKLSKRRYIFWINGLYDYSSPCYRLPDKLVSNKNKYTHVDYYIGDYAHYPMFEKHEKLSNILKDYVIDKFGEKFQLNKQMTNQSIIASRL